MKKLTKEIFTKEQQKEIIKIIKGVFIYTVRKHNITSFEDTILEEIIDSCSKVSEIIDER